MESGFDLCGFARAEPIPRESLSDWLEAGFAADMDWMGARAAERLDVSLLLPGARTVCAFACNFHHEDPPTGPSPIARYARGRDYHANLRDRIRTFRRLVKELWPELKTYSSVDAGPFMEKVWAARAGLGYVGRNGCLITEKFGSSVVLAVFAMDAEVDQYASGAEPDRCGSCNLCVSSCPTEAIDQHSRVDARRCLSYLTIESEGEVPEPFRRAFRDVAFGCDICQDVCPLNDSPLRAQERFAPRPVAERSLLELADMSKEQYGAWIPGTALARAQYDGLRRNAAYALGAAREPKARAILERLLSDESERVRQAAAWALAQLSK